MAHVVKKEKDVFEEIDDCPVVVGSTTESNISLDTSIAIIKGALQRRTVCPHLQRYPLRCHSKETWFDVCGNCFYIFGHITSKHEHLYNCVDVHGIQYHKELGSRGYFRNYNDSFRYDYLKNDANFKINLKHFDDSVDLWFRMKAAILEKRKRARGHESDDVQVPEKVMKQLESDITSTDNDN